MNFNTEIYLTSKINNFRRATGIDDLTIGELYAIVKLNGIHPINDSKNIYSRYDIESLLRSHNSLMAGREKILLDRKKRDAMKTQSIDNTVSRNNVNYYSDDDMQQASDELLRQDDVFFDDERDDELYESLFSRKIYLSESQIEKIKEALNISNQISFNGEKYTANNDPERVKFSIDNQKQMLTFHDSACRAFIILNEDGVYKPVIGIDSSEWHYMIIERLIKAKWVEYYNRTKKQCSWYDYQLTNDYRKSITYFRKHIVAFGRYWRFINDKDINEMVSLQKKVIYFFSFWPQRKIGSKLSGAMNMSPNFLVNMANLVKKEEMFIENTPMYIACGEEMFFEVNEVGQVDKNIDVSSMKPNFDNLHEKTAEEKHRATEEFRQLMNKILGQKLSIHDNQGNFKGEMPMAQYHALTRMDENVTNVPLSKASKELFYNTPDYVSLSVDGNKKMLRWNDRNAVTFINLSNGRTGYGTNSFSNHDELIMDMAEEIASEMNDGKLPSVQQVAGIMSKIKIDAIAYGRYWRGVDDYTIFSYWNRGERKLVGNVKEITSQICKEREIDPDTVYIANGDQEFIKLTDDSIPMLHVDIDKEKKAEELHKLPPEEKWKETAGFRGIRDKILGKKLTKQDGSEMPMAQYNALRYVDENKYINESLIDGFPDDMEMPIPELKSFKKKIVTDGDKIEILYLFGKNGMGLTCELDEIGKEIQKFAEDYFLKLDNEPHFDTCDDVYDFKVIGHKKSDDDKKNLTKDKEYILKRINEMKEKLNKRKVYLTEEQISYIKENSNFVDPNKVLLVNRYLTDNFVRAAMPIMGEDGDPKTLLIVGMKGTDGNVIKNMTAKQLFYKLQDKFQKIFGDRDKRDKFLLQVMKDWYNHKITKDGLLSVNKY